MQIILLENIRSAYNVGNVIRTADALGWEVWLSGYTPSPEDNAKVAKTSLGAEAHVGLKQFITTLDAITYARTQNITVVAAEVMDDAQALYDFSKTRYSDLVVIFGNEVDGVLDQTLKVVDEIVYIPMQGTKESLNVGQTSAIFMWALR